jgi:hypothetical protein
MPRLVLTLGLAKWNPYMMVGAIIGMGSYYREEKLLMEGDNFGVPYNAINDFEKEKYKGNVAIGVNALVGLAYKWKANWTFFTEVSYEGMNYKPNESELVEKTHNGEDILANSQKRYTHSTYANEIEFTPDIDFDEPTPRNRISAPFSNIGFYLGVKLSLTTKE